MEKSNSWDKTLLNEAEQFQAAIWDGFWQKPAQGADQIFDYAKGDKLETVEASTPELNTLSAHAKVAGEAIGSGLNFLLLSKTLGRFSFNKPLTNGLATGFVHGGLFSQSSSSENFLFERLTNALYEASSMAGMAVGAGLLNENGKLLDLRGRHLLGNILRNTTINSALSGSIMAAAEGVIRAGFEGKSVKTDDLAKSVYASAYTGLVTGATLGAFDWQNLSRHNFKNRETKVTLKNERLIDKKQSAESLAIGSSKFFKEQLDVDSLVKENTNEELTHSKLLRSMKEIDTVGHDPGYALMQIAKGDSRLIGFGEIHTSMLHDENGHVQLLANQMPQLKKAGVTTLAVEYPESLQKYFDYFSQTGKLNLPSDSRVPEVEHMKVQQDWRPQYMSLLDAARKSGIKIVAVDHKNAWTSKSLTMQDRDNHMAERLSTLMSDPQEKVIYFAGAGHTKTHDTLIDQGSQTQHESAMSIVKRKNPELKTASIVSQLYGFPSMNFTQFVESLAQPVAFSTAAAKHTGELTFDESNSFGRMQLKHWDYAFLYPEKPGSEQLRFKHALDGLLKGVSDDYLNTSREFESHVWSERLRAQSFQDLEMLLDKAIKDPKTVQGHYYYLDRAQRIINGMNKQFRLEGKSDHLEQLLDMQYRVSRHKRFDPEERVFDVRSTLAEILERNGKYREAKQLYEDNFAEMSVDSQASLNGELFGNYCSSIARLERRLGNNELSENWLLTASKFDRGFEQFHRENADPTNWNPDD